MFGTNRRLDLASLVVVLLTFVLFALALFAEGFTHDILLEAGVFLVSVKLIMMSNKISFVAKEIHQKLEEVQLWCSAQPVDNPDGSRH
jgi:hypothetical protein